MMTQDDVSDFAERMREAKAAKAAERAEAEARGETLEADAAPKPKRKYRKRRTSTRTRGPSTKPPSLRAPIEAMLNTVGTVWDMSERTRGHVVLDEDYPTCGSVLLACSNQIATNLNTLAQADPNVYKWLDRMMTGGGWGGVVLSTWPVAQAVLAAHVMPRLERRSQAEPEPDEAEQWQPAPGA